MANKLFSFFFFLTFSSSCTYLFFQPNKKTYIPKDKIHLKVVEKYLLHSTGEKIHLWYLKQKFEKKTKASVVFFHGNAQNLSSHVGFTFPYLENGYDVFIFDYRGYGKSEGEANVENAVLDCELILEKARRLVPKGRIIAHGQSLGGALLLKALSSKIPLQKNIDLLVLDSTFASFPQIAQAKLEGNWITWLFQPLAYVLVSDEGSSLGDLKNVNTPTIFIHSQKDPVVPFSEGKKIAKRLPKLRKRYIFSKRNHGAFILDPEFQRSFFEFIVSMSI